MSQIGVLTTGDGVSSIFNLNYVPEFIQIGDPSAVLAAEGLSIAISGQNSLNIQDADLLQAYARFLNEITKTSGSAVTIASVIRVSDGLIGNESCQIRITNDGVTTPNVFAWSENEGSQPILAGTETIQSLTDGVFTNFAALFFKPANVDYADVVFSSGVRQKMEVEELKARFMMESQSENSGLLDGCLVVDNTDDSIMEFILRANNSGNVTLLKVV